MGPIATGLGEIYQFKVTGPGRSLMELRSILDWDIAPKLRTVPGIVEVNTHGGELKTYEVELDNDKLAAYGITLREDDHGTRTRTTPMPAEHTWSASSSSRWSAARRSSRTCRTSRTS